MIVLAVIATLILILLLAPIGVHIKYSDDFVLWLWYAGINIRLIPGKTKKKQKQKTPKPKQKKQQKLKLTFDDVLLLVRKGAEAIKNVVKSLRFKRFKLAVTVSGEDPASAAINYGRACAAASAVYPVFEKCFDKNNTDISIDLDCCGNTKAEADIIIKATTLRLIITALKAVFAIIPILTKKNKKGGASDERSK